ncbi:MAG: aldehyde ferredoxin oxidoreductase, partial [Thermoprotei archaeon]
MDMKEKWFSYAGQIIRVDLSRSKIRIEDLKEEDVEYFLGGQGIATKILFEELDPHIDPLSPDNKLVFMTGALTGTMVPGACRAIVAARSPLTMGWGEAHFGGFWGPELKRAGYDGIIIEGKSKDPVYLFVYNDRVEIRDASKLWGLMTSETERSLKSELKDNDFKIACIGPAGERLVRYACIISGERAAGRTGMGAVMGSKNLKAIAVKGTGEIEVKNPDRLKRDVARLYPLIMSYPPTQILSSYGTNGEMLSFYKYGDVPIKNFTKGEWDGIVRIEGKNIVKKYLVKHKACFSCPIGCWKHVRIDEGEFKGTEGRGPEYETAASLGALLLNDNSESLIYLEKLCNDIGIDTISTGVTIAWAFEAFERGIITEGDTGGLKLKWGDYKLIIELVKMIGTRRGFGKLLGEGCYRAAKTIGRNSIEIAMHVRGLEIPMHDPRAFKGMGLQYATSNRGACHMQGFFLRIEQGERIPDLKIYRRINRFDTKGKGWMVAVIVDWHEVLDALGLCKFVQIYPGHVAGFYSIATGYIKRVRDLLLVGERIYNLKRMFNIICGMGGEYDKLPGRFLKEPLKEGGAKGQVVELDEMLR